MLFRSQIGLSVASRLAGLDKGQQEEALKKQPMTLADIEALKQSKDTKTVSNLDTGEVYGSVSLDQANGNETVSNLDTSKEIIPQPAAEDRDLEQTVADRAESKPAAVENEENKKDTVAERTEILQPRGVGYALEEVRQIYDEQVTMIRQFERIRKFGDLSEDDELQYKRSKIIRDGMTYILDAFQEGTIC